jgi:tRNA pseudouridine13 synthase
LNLAADADIAVGIESYGTEGSPCHGRAKSTPEDFRVGERVTLEGLTQEDRPEYYPLYEVEKRGIDTLHMASEISEALKSKVTFGGLKDKRARTIQYVTPSSLRAERPERVVGEKFTAVRVGFVPVPMVRASVTGNHFEIVLRDCCPEVGERIEDVFRAAKGRRLPNFYGLQRFGVSGVGTHRVGKAIVAWDFERAVRVLLDVEGDSPVDTGEVSRTLPPGKDIEMEVVRELGRHPGEWVRALRAVPVRVRRLYVQAYQSFIFNRTLSLALSKGEDISHARRGDNWVHGPAEGLSSSKVMGVREVPTEGAAPMVQVVGYAFRDYGSRFDACLKEVLKHEGVLTQRFYVDEMQEVSAEGGFRKPHMDVTDEAWSVEGDSARLSFTLAKGEYATVLLREIIKPSDPSAAGLA